MLPLYFVTAWVTVMGNCTRSTLHNITSTTNTYRYCSCSCPTNSTLHNITSTTNTYRYCSCFCPTHNTLHNITSTTNTYRQCSCSCPTYSNFHPLHIIRQSALRTQTTISVRDSPERSRILPKSHVLQKRKYLFRVAFGMCEFKQHG